MCNDVHHNRETGKEKILLTDEISLLNLATETSLVWLFAEAQITVRPQMILLGLHHLPSSYSYNQTELDKKPRLESKEEEEEERHIRIKKSK